MYHFQKSFYDDLTSEHSELLVNVIKQYQIRKKLNTCSNEEARLIMAQSNPRFILRNYLLHQAIEEMEKGQNELFIKLQQAIKYPYAKQYDEFFEIRPGWASQKAGCSMLSCSS